jgi:hypothetical protein
MMVQYVRYWYVLLGHLYNYLIEYFQSQRCPNLQVFYKCEILNLCGMAVYFVLTRGDLQRRE